MRTLDLVSGSTSHMAFDAIVRSICRTAAYSRQVLVLRSSCKEKRALFEFEWNATLIGYYTSVDLSRRPHARSAKTPFATVTVGGGEVHKISVRRLSRAF
jgi:hypothetical protein